MTTSAFDMVENLSLMIDPITAAKPSAISDELAHFHLGQDDMDEIFLKIYGFGNKGATDYEDIRASVLDASFDDAIDETSSFTLTVRDPDWELLNTGALDNEIDINPGKIPHRWYQLYTVAVQGDTLTLTFITRNAAYLMMHKRPVKVSRRKITRAEFILSLIQKVKKHGVKIKFFSPELHKVQPIAKFSEGQRTTRDKNREAGFAAGAKITIKSWDGGNHTLTEDELKNAGLAIDAANAQGASARPRKALLEACIVEAPFFANPLGGDSSSVGILQLLDIHLRGSTSTHGGRRDVTKVCTLFLTEGFTSAGGAIELAVKHPDWSPGRIAQAVQGSAFPARYDAVSDGADKVYEEYHGGTAVAVSTQYAAQYAYSVGLPQGPERENYLAAIYRMADEVNWSAFWVRDELYYISQEDLFKSRARARMRRYEQGVEDVSFSWDRGKKLNEMTVSVRMDRWVCPIGTVIIFDEGGPARGRWLVTHITRSIFSTLGDITLSKPIVEKKEPAHDMASRGTVDATPTDPGNFDGTPKDIIDNVVIPYAQNLGFTVTPKSVEKANASHGPTQGGNRSDHEGPPEYAWAADISNSVTPSKEEDEFAKWLGKTFHIDPPWGGNSCHEHSDKHFRYQICYRMNTAQAGNHFTHVHIGIKALDVKPPHPNQKT